MAGTTLPPLLSTLPALALPVLWLFLLLLLLMLPAPAAPPPLACCIFKSGFSLFVRFTNRKIASDYTTCSVCSPFWCGQTSPPVLAFFSPPSYCLFLFLLLLLLLLFLLLLLLAGINIAAFIYAVYICTLPSPTSCKLLPLFPPLSPSFFLYFPPSSYQLRPTVLSLQLGQLTLLPGSSWAAGSAWLNGCTRCRLTRAPPLSF